jgi:eukaryotic-like serine/threonine-protein kinase
MEHAPAAQVRERVGTVLRGKWTIDALIGIGGMAAVYSATHRNGKRVAIKVLHRVYARLEEICARFLREGYAANRVGHPGSLAVLDDDTAEDGSVFLVMELLEGQSLGKRLADVGQLQPAEALFIADQVLDVLGAAHERGIVHRDIKPGNIFLLRDGTVKVLDFGLARLKEGPGSEMVTRDGWVIGTVSFMSPEQARARHDLITARSDLWSVGATMFVALSHHTVHEAPTAMDRLQLAIRKPARSLATVRADLPAEIVALVDRALAYDEKDRWEDARAMQSAVRAAYRSITGQPIPSTARTEYCGAAGWLRPALASQSGSASPVSSLHSVDVSVVFEPDARATPLNIAVKIAGTEPTRELSPSEVEWESTSRR